jgi:hydroxypyruvate reductase
MAKAVEDNWRGQLSGLVVTRYEHGTDCRSIEVVEAGHPVPDAAGQRAAQRMLSLVRGLTEDDLVLCLISGGGSSLLAVPAPGISLADKQTVTRALLKSGAPIAQINCVRKHLSAVKGGRLALAAAPAPVVTLMISDVPGDDPATVASGPTVPDPTTRRDALGILANYSIDLPDSVRRWLEDPRSETPKPGDPGFARVYNRIIATADDALSAAAHAAELAKIRPVVLGSAIQGEARDVAREHARLALKCVRRGDPARPPCVLLSGGETTVTVAGSGRGGRNSEYLLALALELNGLPGHAALACDTDGIDGTERNAGAIADAYTLKLAKERGAAPEDALARNDAYGFFDALGDLVTTGPTRTNVNDFRAILLTESGH